MWFGDSTDRKYCMGMDKKLVTIKVTMSEIWSAMKPSVHRNRKKYTRKDKHKGKGYEV